MATTFWNINKYLSFPIYPIPFSNKNADNGEDNGEDNIIDLFPNIVVHCIDIMPSTVFKTFSLQLVLTCPDEGGGSSTLKIMPVRGLEHYVIAFLLFPPLPP